MSDDLKSAVTSLIDAPLRSLIKLHGDASYRTYYRATSIDEATYIVMQMPPGTQSVSEEITNYNGTHEELPFINMTRFLERCGLPVPKIIAQDKERHILILEDLGDGLMFSLVDGKPLDVQRTWYAKAIDLLLRLQESAEGHKDNGCIAFRRSFDKTLYDWEFDHFLEYGIEARLNTTMEADDRAVFDRETRRISDELERLPYGFTHRDFQSRNLIIKDSGLYMIDYQDALMGPRAYDLVALLRDSYVVLPTGLVLELVSYYAERKGVDAAEVQGQFDLVTIQRKLKDAGRFVFIDRVKHNPKFLPNIPASLAYVKEAFERLGTHGELYEVLKKYVPEWNTNLSFRPNEQRE